MHDHHQQSGDTSVLASLRALLPNRKLRLTEALAIAGRQAELLRLRQMQDIPVPVSIVSGLPRITAVCDPTLPRQAVSGASHWDSRRKSWIISINPDEPRTRQRFTVLHEYKHILDHGHPGLTGPLPRSIYGLTPNEYLAEYFAGCVLMPKRLLQQAFYDGIQDAHDLAELFDVSVRAIEVRLQQLGLTDPPAAARPVFQRGLAGVRLGRRARYYRQCSTTWLLTKNPSIDRREVINA